MYRLRGSDANFLYQETPTAPMHTIKVYIIEDPDFDFDYHLCRAALPAPG